MTADIVIPADWAAGSRARAVNILGGREPLSSVLSMPVASFVATGTACGRHSVAARARGGSLPLSRLPFPSALF